VNCDSPLSRRSFKFRYHQFLFALQTTNKICLRKIKLNNVESTFFIVTCMRQAEITKEIWRCTAAAGRWRESEGLRRPSYRSKFNCNWLGTYRAMRTNPAIATSVKRTGMYGQPDVIESSHHNQSEIGCTSRKPLDWYILIGFMLTILNFNGEYIPTFRDMTGSLDGRASSRDLHLWTSFFHSTRSTHHTLVVWIRQLNVLPSPQQFKRFVTILSPCTRTDGNQSTAYGLPLVVTLPSANREVCVSLTTWNTPLSNKRWSLLRNRYLSKFQAPG
jgi:hypothetical protein